jgi:hypothetical protein
MAICSPLSRWLRAGSERSALQKSLALAQFSGAALNGEAPRADGTPYAQRFADPAAATIVGFTVREGLELVARGLKHLAEDVGRTFKGLGPVGL